MLLPFALSRTHGESAPPLCDHLLLARFDIDTGSTIEARHPSRTACDADDGLAELMLPDGAHTRERDSSVFFLNRSGPRYFDEEDSSGGGAPFLYCCNVVRTRLDSSLRRGADVRALTLCSRWPFVDVVRAELLTALDACLEPDADAAAIIARLYNALNALSTSQLPFPTPTERALFWRGVTARTCGDACRAHWPAPWTATLGTEDGISLSIPLWVGADDIGGNHGPARLVAMFGAEQAVKIFSAVWARARIVFCGYAHNGVATEQVVSCVLSAASLVSPSLVGTLRRAFPFATLADLSFLQVPGYIAGVTNPVFESKEEWWDVMCFLDPQQRSDRSSVVVLSAQYESWRAQTAAASHNVTAALGVGGAGFGRITAALAARSPEDGDVEGTAHSEPSDEGGDSARKARVARAHGALLLAAERAHDDGFARRITSCLDPSEAGGRAQASVDVWIAHCFRELSSEIVGLLNDASQSDALQLASPPTSHAVAMAAAHAARVAVFLASDDSADSLCGAPTRTDCDSLPQSDKEWIRRATRRLEVESQLPDDDAEAILVGLEVRLRSDEALRFFLIMLPEVRGGLNPIAAGLYHERVVVREAAAKILHKLESQCEATAPAVRALNPLHCVQQRLLLVQ